MIPIQKFLFLVCVGITATAPAVLAADDSTPEFNIQHYGAVADDGVPDTLAIQKAIEACRAAGGGRLMIPSGRYLSGTIRLASDMELHLAKGARLVGVTDLNAYGGFRSGNWGKNRWNRGLIVAEQVQNVAITGAGTIDGNKVFDPKGEAKMRGPHTILISDGKHVRLEGVTIIDSANYAFLFYASTHVRVIGATFKGGWDGVHFRGSPDRWNRDVTISKCRFYTGDDCIAGHYIQDAVVEDCTINSSCNGVRLIGPAKRLSFLRCDFNGPGKFEHRTPQNLHRTNMLAAMIFQPSAWTPTPGPLEDVLVKDVMIRNVACALHVSTRDGNTADRLLFQNIKAADVYSSAVSIESWTEKPIGEVTLRNVEVSYAPDAVIDPRLGRAPSIQDPIRKPGVGVWGRKLPVWGIYGRNIKKLTLKDVTLRTADASDVRPVIGLDGVETFTNEGFARWPSPAGSKQVQRNELR